MSALTNLSAPYFPPSLQYSTPTILPASFDHPPIPMVGDGTPNWQLRPPPHELPSADSARDDLQPSAGFRRHRDTGNGRRRKKGRVGVAGGRGERSLNFPNGSSPPRAQLYSASNRKFIQIGLDGGLRTTIHSNSLYGEVT